MDVAFEPGCCPGSNEIIVRAIPNKEGEDPAIVRVQAGWQPMEMLRQERVQNDAEVVNVYGVTELNSVHIH